MTDEIALAIENAKTLTELEDIYRPFRPKRKTRASVAKALGLDGLAEKIYAQEKGTPSPVGLRILSSSTCVGLRYGHLSIRQSFSRLKASRTSLL